MKSTDMHGGLLLGFSAAQLAALSFLCASEGEFSAAFYLASLKKKNNSHGGERR